MDTTAQTPTKKKKRGGKKNKNASPADMTPKTPLSPTASLATATSASDDITQSFATAQRRVCDMVARPNYGTLGEEAKVFANVFAVKFKPIAVHHYNVDIKPSASPPRGGGRGRGRGRGRSAPSRPEGPVELKPDMMNLVFKAFLGGGRNSLPLGASFDGNKNLYVPGKRMEDIRDSRVTITIDDKQKQFNVSISHVASTNLSEVEAYMNGTLRDYPAVSLAAIDVAFRHIASLQNGVVRDESAIFKCDSFARMIAPGVQAWAGYVQSTKPCQLGLVLNMNTCFTPMIKQQTVAEYITEFVGGSYQRNIPTNQIHNDIRPQMYTNIAEKISKLKAKSIHDRRRETHVKLAGFTDKSASQTMITDKNGSISAVEYLRRNCGYIVKYPNLKMVTIYKGNKIHRLTYPPECLLIKGVPFRRKMSEPQKERLIKAATLNPKEKRSFIEERHRDQMSTSTNVSHMNAWGIDVDENMPQIPSRILPPPGLEGGDNEFIEVPSHEGGWDVNRYKFYQPATIESWAFVNFCKSENINKGILQFFTDLIAKMKKRGMTVPAIPYKLDYDYKDIYHTSDILKFAKEKAFEKFGKKCDIIIVLMPEFSQGSGIDTVTTENLYRRIKVASDQEIGIASQCIFAPNAKLVGKDAGPCSPAYISHLTLKLNAKLGGINSILYNHPGAKRTFEFPKFGNSPFMVMGADLTHPPPNSEDKRSVVGVVGSIDETLSKYACRVQFQQEGLQTGRETIVDLKSAAKSLLLAYHNNNKGLKPEAILFYRDGVSQGEFGRVVQHEFQAVRDACTEMGDPSAEYCPPITFIVVAKRHAMRFLPGNGKTDASGNVPPGTCIDSKVCHPHGFDFYLNSHAGIQGTSRSALYSVLVDEVGFKADDLQLLTYWMCHLFCRCTKSVSYCPPAYLAHHSAARGKILLLDGADNIQKPVHQNLVDKLFFV